MKSFLKLVTSNRYIKKEIKKMDISKSYKETKKFKRKWLLKNFVKNFTK